MIRHENGISNVFIGVVRVTTGHSANIKKAKTDEWYTYENSVELIIPYLEKSGFATIWCPFDTKDSNFVKKLTAEGFSVVYGHIDTGQDFFAHDKVPKGVEVVVSNPPFSKRQKIFEKLFGWKIPFALIMNSNGLFDAKARFDLFNDNQFELLIPKGRMKFFKEEDTKRNSPNFQSIYVCSQILDKQVILDSSIKY